MRFESARRKIAQLLYDRFVSPEDSREFKKGSSVFQIIQSRKAATAAAAATPGVPPGPSVPGAPVAGDEKSEKKDEKKEPLSSKPSCHPCASRPVLLHLFVPLHNRTVTIIRQLTVIAHSFGD
jgi:hypothetical protein